MEPVLKRAYSALPVEAQNIAFTAWGYLTKAQRYGKEFHRRLEWLQSSQWWSELEIEAYQSEELQRVVSHAYAHVPAYRQAMESRALTPRDIRSPEDLQRLPVISKQDIRLHPGSFRSAAHHRRRLIRVRTSGTTGTPLVVYLTPEALQFQWAIWWRHRARFNLHLGDKFLTFGARLPVPKRTTSPPYWRYNRAINQVYLSTYHLTPATMPRVIDWLNGENFSFFTGYPSAMYVLAHFLIEKEATLNNPPRQVVAGSDALIPGFERVIRDAFGAPVTDQYGSAEACGNFARCEKGKYHLDAEFCLVELLPVENSRNPLLRRLVFTGFANPAMPFIRYDSGDLGLISEQPCTCGRQTLTLDRIEGRTEDYIRTPDGRMAVGMNQVFEWAPNLLEAQVRQNRLEEIEVLIVPAKGYGSTDQRTLEREFRARLGDEIKIVYHIVDAIPRAESGKFRGVVSTISGEGTEERDLQKAVSDGLF